MSSSSVAANAENDERSIAALKTSTIDSLKSRFMVTSVSDLKDKLKTCCPKGQYQAPKKLHCKIQSIFLLQSIISFLNLLRKCIIKYIRTDSANEHILFLSPLIRIWVLILYSWHSIIQSKKSLLYFCS